MWKKLAVMGIALLGTFSVVYAFNHDLMATSTTYNAGGAVTGRVNQAPAGIASDNIGMKKGDKVLLGVSNPNTNAKYSNVVLQLVNYENYSDYGCYSLTTACSGDVIDSWYSLTYDSIGYLSNNLSEADFKYTDASTSYTNYQVADYNKSIFSDIATHLTNETQNYSDKEILANNNLSVIRNTIKNAGGGDASLVQQGTVKAYFSDPITYNKGFFTPFSGLPYQAKDVAFTSEYWTEVAFHQAGSGRVYQNLILKTDGSGYNAYGDSSYYNIALSSNSRKFDLRFGAYVDMKNVVFSSSKGNSEIFAQITPPNLPSAYTNIVVDSIGEPMKLRINDTDDPIEVKLLDLVNTLGNTVSTIEKNEKVYIKAKADNARGTTVSVVFFDSTTSAFKYYKPLEAAKGMSEELYELDLTGVEAGTYKIAIVNEEYDETSTAPAYSSLFSDTKTLEIKDQAGMSDLKNEFTMTGGTDLTDVFKTTSLGNAKKGDIIANTSVTNGIGSPSKISYIPIMDTTASNAYDYLNIKTGADKYPILNGSKAQLGIQKGTGTDDFLAPDVYKYRIQAYDENGNPYPVKDASGNELTDNKKLANTKTVKESPHYNVNGNTVTENSINGIISDDIEFVVYPHETQITYAESKDANNFPYKKDDINDSGFTNHVGTLTFETAANMQELLKDGYTIDTSTSKLMEKGSTTKQYSEFKISSDTTNPSKYFIDKKSNVESGTYTFDVWLYFKNSKGTDTALLKLTDQSLYIAPSLKFVDPDDAMKFLTTDTYSRKYNAYASADNNENIFTLTSTDTTDFTSNSSVKYCILDETLKTCATSNDTDVLTLVDNGNGTASITAKTYQKDDPNVIVRSYIEDSEGKILTYEDVTIQIERSERKMKWEGTKFSSLSSTVTANEDGSFELKLPYDSANPVEYSYSKILRDAAKPDDGTLVLRHDEGTGTLSSTMSGNLTEGSKADSFKLSGQCTGTTCYIEASKAQDDIFEAGSVKLYIVTESLPEITTDKIAWNYKDDNTTSSSWKVAGNPLSVNYKENGINSVKIDTSKLPTDIKNVSITYTLEDSKKAETISVANKNGSKTEAEMNILQANQTTDNASIKAVISSDNYAQKTVLLPVKINKLKQTINFNTTFKDLATNIKVDTSANYDYTASIMVNATTAGKGTISYTVAGTPTDMLTNNSTNKTYNVSKAGSVTVTATLTDDINYESTTKSITKTITYFADAGLTWTQEQPNPEAVNTVDGGTTGNADVNKELGDVKIDGGKSAAYNFTVDNTKHSDDSTYFSVVVNADKKSGRLKIIKKIDAAALNAHAAQVGKGDTYEWIIKLKATSTTDSTEIAQSEIKITFVGAQPNITFTKADSNKKITDTYATSKNLDLSVKRDNTSASDPTVSITGYTSALGLNVDGVSALIKAANTDNSDKVRSGRKVEVTAQVPASAGYKTWTSSANEVIIKKANHPTIDFKEKTLSSSNNVDVEITGILNGNGKSNETVTITPIRGDVNDPWIINPFTISKDEAYLTPSLPMSPKGYLGTVDFTIVASGDDNYKPLPANTKTTVEFTEDGGIVYKPIVVTYGDKSKGVLDFIVTPNPKDDPDTVTYSYKGFDETIVKIDADGNITPVKVGETTLTFKRMDSADSSEMEQNIKVTVKPKDITIYVNSLNKKVGEVVNTSDFSIDTAKSTAFETGDDVGTLTYSCQDNNVEVTTLVNGLMGPAPKSLPISATHVGGNAEHKANYKITYKPGTLKITQDDGLESWISVVPKGTTTFKNNWYNGDVDVKINAIAGSYSEISPDGNAPWQSSFTVIDEGKISQEIAFRDPLTLAKAKSITKEILIDRHAPRVEKITAKSSNNKLEDILNTLTFGTLFQPGTQFTINTSDKVNSRAIVNQVSGTNSLTYSIYRIEKDNSETELEKDKTVTVKDEAVGVKISDSSGTYKVCTTATDLAGNKGTQSCAKVVIGYKGMDETTGDNTCPDLNLDFNDDGKAELNIDANGDKIPELNIDSDFDGEADINVDSDGDLKPDINLVILKSWKPGTCSVVKGKNYATMEGIKPEINIVVDNGTDEIKKQIPSLNIDNVGDFKPHLNISMDGKTASVNITKLHEWKPIHDYKKDTFVYDSIGQDEGEPFPELEIDTDNDGLPDLNIDLDKDGTPDLNIDSNYDGIPELNIDGDGDGTPDYNLEVDKNGKPTKNVIIINKWEPNLNGNKDGKEFDTMEIKTKGELEDNGVKVEKPGGTFLPNYAIKVTDAKDSISDEEKDKINAYVKEGNEIKDILDVKLYEGDSVVQPDGTLKVRLPLRNSYKGDSIKVIVEQADGTFIQVDAKVEDGYLVYDTNYLGKVSIIGDKESDGSTTTPDPDNKPSDTPDPTPTPTPDTDTTPNQGTGNNGSNNPSTSVKGTYISGTGGALTGDSTNMGILGISMLISILCCVQIYKKRNS